MQFGIPMVLPLLLLYKFFPFSFQLCLVEAGNTHVFVPPPKNLTWPKLSWRRQGMDKAHPFKQLRN